MISVVIPALNEAMNIDYVIDLARESGCVDEIIVVDDGSIDDTPLKATSAGARVITSSLLGKGASMEDGLLESRGQIVIFLDGDLRGLDRSLIQRLVDPIKDGRADFVKARFSRNSGRVTTLTAKPLLATFFPELVHFAQPLGGIVAARRELLERLDFEQDFGVDLALLIDAHFAQARIAEVDIGHLEHDSQSLEALGEMAKQVVRSLLRRAHRHGRMSIGQVQEMEEVERQAKAEFAVVLSRMGGADKLALFDMDGTLLRGRSVVELAERTGRLGAIQQYLDNPQLDPVARTKKIAECLAGVPREEFLEIARTMPLSEGAAETVIGLRKLGYRVGIVSDSFRIVTEIVRRRVFADFSIANLIRFREGKATGEISLPPIFQHRQGCKEHEVCKRNVLLHLEEKLAISPLSVVAIGDSANDLCLLREAGIGIAFEPKSQSVATTASHVVRGDMRQILEICSVHTQLAVPA